MRRITDKEILRGYTSVAEDCSSQDLAGSLDNIARHYRATQVIVSGTLIDGSIHGDLTVYIPTSEYESAIMRNPRLAVKVHLKVGGDTRRIREVGKRLEAAINAKPNSNVQIGMTPEQMAKAWRKH